MAMPAFEYEYSYRISVDEEILQRYEEYYPSKFCNAKCLFEIRSNFIVKGRRSSSSSSEIFIDSEGYAIEEVKHDSDAYLNFVIGIRLRDYWMPDDQVNRLVAELLDFAKQTSVSSASAQMIQVAVDLDVCTVQREGEETGAALERALRPELLPPLYLYPTENPKRGPDGDLYYKGNWDVSHLVGKLKNVRVEDASSASAVKATVMEVCGVCGREPVAGGQVSTIQCGHSFHYSCIARRLLEEERNSCPICNHRPAVDEAKTGVVKDLDVNDSFFVHAMYSHLGNLLSDSDEDEDEDLEDCEDLEDYCYEDEEDDSDMEDCNEADSNTKDCNCNHNVSFIFRDDDDK